MPAPKLTKIKSWEECPILMTIAQTEELVGISRQVLDAWVKIGGFPILKDGTQKIHRDLLRVWIDKRIGNGLEKVLLEEEINNKYQEKVDSAIENIENRLIKLCDDLTQKENKEDLFKVMIKEFAGVLKTNEVKLMNKH